MKVLSKMALSLARCLVQPPPVPPIPNLTPTLLPGRFSLPFYKHFVWGYLSPPTSHCGVDVYFSEPGPSGSVFLLWQEEAVTLLQEHEAARETKCEEIPLIYSGLDIAHGGWLKRKSWLPLNHFDGYFCCPLYGLVFMPKEVTEGGNMGQQ